MQEKCGKCVTILIKYTATIIDKVAFGKHLTNNLLLQFYPLTTKLWVWLIHMYLISYKTIILDACNRIGNKIFMSNFTLTQWNQMIIVVSTIVRMVT